MSETRQTPTEMAGILLTEIRDSLLDLDEAAQPDDDLFAAGLDSMGIMHLLLVIEEKFDIQLGPADVSREHFQSAESIARLVTSRLDD